MIKKINEKELIRKFKNITVFLNIIEIFCK